MGFALNDDVRMQAGGGSHVHQRIQRKQANLSAHQVGNTRLSHAKQSGRILLRHAT
jgi:hypothetical protein